MKTLKIAFVFYLLCLSNLLWASDKNPNLKTVEKLELASYLGDWFQISHIPLAFEEGGKPNPCARQRFTLNDGLVGVENTANIQTVDGQPFSIKGFVEYSDPQSPSKFKVTLNVSPTQTVTGTYWVIGLDHDYRYSAVSNESGTSLYILSRQPVLDEVLYNEALYQATSQGLDITKLVFTDHTGCQYPN